MYSSSVFCGEKGTAHHYKERGNELARKTMGKQITTTTVKSAVVEMVDGKVSGRSLEDEVFIGNLTMEQAKKEIDKLHPDLNAQVMEVIPETNRYTMPVEKYMELATKQ